jgi:hypothetical protein
VNFKAICQHTSRKTGWAIAYIEIASGFSRFSPRAFQLPYAFSSFFSYAFLLLFVRFLASTYALLAYRQRFG